MEKVKVVKIYTEGVYFDNGMELSSFHESECCEHHYLSLSDLTMTDFEGLEFDLFTDDFFERIPDYGIALKPITGHSVGIPGYGSNNGCYSSNLYLILSDASGKTIKSFNITACQVITD